VRLGAFAIDALPYPNHPASPPLFVETRAEAAEACAREREGDGRLCTELEWERACGGPDADAFATGASWNRACDEAPSRCASGYGVRAMGFLTEWVDGDVKRGGGAHRCAARSGPQKKTGPGPGAGRAAVRCCHGERNGAGVPEIDSAPPFRKTDLDAEALQGIFADIPELARLREGVRLFSEEELRSRVLERSSASADGISFATAPIRWSPERGVELLVVTGRAKKTGFVVALWEWPSESPDERHYRYASSFLLLNDPAPVALAWEPGKRKSLLWTRCFNCAGEQGAVSLRDDGRVVIVQY
jgi:hypothetical protein